MIPGLASISRKTVVILFITVIHCLLMAWISAKSTSSCETPLGRQVRLSYLCAVAASGISSQQDSTIIADSRGFSFQIYVSIYKKPNDACRKTHNGSEVQGLRPPESHRNARRHHRRDSSGNIGAGVH